ncbi:MAG TPA: HlyD family efflux transporter periplasmic adaptor subunit [Vicinamibacterales bacterium]|jgi:HlyD family secretion protein|nr:HlyD family efflux transporter periplasmic adaptor subunit [Vicinamibacterales bacterium]
MDVKRDPAILRRKKIRRGILLGVGAVAVIAISVAVSRLKPAAPSIANARSTLWINKVKRGPFVREVRGAGTLVPEDIRWIPATTSGRVEKIVLRPGAQVVPGTVVLELSNPDLTQSVKSAELDWKTAVAQLANEKATLATTLLQQQLAVSNAKSDLQIAQSELESNKTLGEEGLVADFVVKQKDAAVARAQNAYDLAERQLESAKENESLQLAPDEAAVNQRKAEYDRLRQQLDDLRVKSDMSGQLQVVSVEVGQQVAPGTNLIRVSDPTHLKAEVRISETLTRDLKIGLPADIDTRNGHVPGQVSRIDPAAESGTVGVDVTLNGPLPPGSRPDLSVDGTIQLERVADALYVESPAFGQENSTITLFKVLPGGTEAVRVPVKIGRRAVQYVEIVDGLKEGDEVILSDMSQYDAFNRVRLN